MNKTYFSFLLLVTTAHTLFSADQQAQEHIKTLQKFNKTLNKNCHKTNKLLKQRDELLEQTKKKLEEQEKDIHQLLAFLVGSASRASNAIDALPQCREQLSSAVQESTLPETAQQLYKDFDRALTREFKKEANDIPGTQGSNNFNFPLLDTLRNAPSLPLQRKNDE